MMVIIDNNGSIGPTFWTKPKWTISSCWYKAYFLQAFTYFSSPLSPFISFLPFTYINVHEFWCFMFIYLFLSYPLFIFKIVFIKYLFKTLC